MRSKFEAFALILRGHNITLKCFSGRVNVVHGPWWWIASQACWFCFCLAWHAILPLLSSSTTRTTTLLSSARIHETYLALGKIHSSLRCSSRLCHTVSETQILFRKPEYIFRKIPRFLMTDAAATNTWLVCSLLNRGKSLLESWGTTFLSDWQPPLIFVWFT